ncbi:MAG TPA: sulfatase-like hydrolase/transferase [Bryobacteraceae bacterium]|nr:sulfatase-like hydrolase/transferase [Bryobacteraceae bacterium]
MLTRRSFVAGASAATARAAASKPNFLFLIADDHAGYVLGADGNRQANTPHLDMLASQGTRFAAHYCNSPVCTPSRQSFFTGQLPHAAGVTVLKTPLATDKPTLARQLKAAGYETAVFGKMHFNRPGSPGLHGFDRLLTENELTQAWSHSPAIAIPAGTATKKLPWKPFADPARIWLNADNLPYPRICEEMRSAFLMRNAFEYLEAHQAKPFAMWLSFQEPHSPFDFPVDSRRRLQQSGEFTPPAAGKEDAWQVPLIFRDLSPEDKQGIIAAYYNSVSYLDSNIGAVLAKLRSLGLEENTLVVYMADHGYSLGQHGRFEKHCCYDPALRVPLLMRWPGHVRESVVHDFTESVDVPGTILDLLGADPLPLMHGRSLRAYLQGQKVAAARDHVFSEYLENEEACMRTATHKYIYCSGKRERTDGYKTADPTPGKYRRLFDLRTDPGELEDISSENSGIVSRLQQMMLARFRETHPESDREPRRLSTDELLDWYLRPRDALAENR